jgi:predicted transcriptional regulator
MSKWKPTTVNIRTDQHKRLSELAEEEERSISFYVRRGIDALLAQREKKEPDNSASKNNQED